jgi:hypothetical protein
MPSLPGNEDREDLTHHTPSKKKAVIQGLKRNARYVLRVQLVIATLYSYYKRRSACYEIQNPYLLH